MQLPYYVRNFLAWPAMAIDLAFTRQPVWLPLAGGIGAVWYYAGTENMATLGMAYLAGGVGFTVANQVCIKWLPSCNNQ